MSNADRLRIVFHGGVILLIALACGIPSVLEVSAGTGRMWQAAHSALLILGVLLLAAAAVLPLLVLPRREATALIWSLLLTAYSFATVAIVQAVLGRHVHGPSAAPLEMAVFFANILAVFGAFVSVSLIVMGAHAALRTARAG